MVFKDCFTPYKMLVLFDIKIIRVIDTYKREN